jgi:uncharacterized membrane protein
MNPNAHLANWIATVATCVTATLLVVLSLPMIRGSVKPNRVYGLRAPKTLRDERIWYAANRLMGKNLLVAGAVALTVAIVLMVANRSL